MNLAKINHPEELIELVDYESKIQDFYIDKSRKISVELFIKNGKTFFTSNSLVEIIVKIHVDNLVFSSRLDRPFLHQIGSRIWKDELSYAKIQKHWIKEINESTVNASILIRNTIYDNNFVIRYKEINELNIYGIVTDKYNPTNQLEFRENFIMEAIKTKTINTNNSKIIKRSSGTIEERFVFNDKSRTVHLECSIVYGKNTGYNSYKVRWYRKSKEDGMWFTPWESENKYEWRNNSKSEIKDFVKYLIDEGTEHNKFLEERIEMAKSKSIENDFIDFFMNRMLIAFATKDKIKDRYKIDSCKFGKTAWALSHSLRFLGTNENHTSKSTKWLLLETGTLIFEKEFKDYLESTKEISLTGTFQTYDKQ